MFSFVKEKRKEAVVEKTIRSATFENHEQSPKRQLLQMHGMKEAA